MSRGLQRLIADDNRSIGPRTSLPMPIEIKKFLDDTSSARTEKKSWPSPSTTYKRLVQKQSRRRHDVELTKSNILLIGPTGTGEDAAAQTLARLLSVPSHR
jgi:ATP-dependent Clp protease ATP-binding subunit ClpX